MARRRRPPILPSYLRPLTEAQIRAEANRQLADVYNPQRKEIQDDARSRAATIQAASQAAAQLLASHAGITGDAYTQANQELQGIGSGYSAEMQARIKGAQDAAAQFAASQGAPATDPAVDATALHDTVYHEGVGIPGSSLASQGAAAVAAQNREAGIPLLQGAQDIRQSEVDTEKQLLDLARTRPELRDKIIEAIYQREMQKLDARQKQQAQDLYEAQFGETVRSHMVDEQTDRLKYEEQVRAHNLAISQAKAEGRQPNASLSKAYGYIVDSQGRPILDKNGKHIPVNQNTSSSSQKQKQNAQYQKAVGEAANMFEQSQPSKTLKIPGAPYDPVTNPYVEGPPERAWRWGNAMRYLMTRYGINKSRARAALIAAGFKPPSNRGPRGPQPGTGPR
jgi:hypothetical protein